MSGFSLRVNWTSTHAVWLGNPETGSAIPVEETNAVTKTRRRAGLPGRFIPTSLAMEHRSTLAIVWLMNVDTTCREEWISHAEASMLTDRVAYQHN